MSVLSHRSVILSCLLSSVSFSAYAQQAPQPQRTPTVLDTVTSSATRTDRAVGARHGAASIPLMLLAGIAVNAIAFSLIGMLI